MADQDSKADGDEGPVGTLTGLAAEIDAGVTAAVEEIARGQLVSGNAPNEVDLGSDEVEDRTLEGGDKGGEGEEGEAEAGQARDAQGRFASSKPEGLSEAALERAVKAGIPLAEAKQYPNDALLNATCARVEGVGKVSGSQPGAGGDEVRGGEAEPAGADELLSKIPDLNPDEYDEQLVSGFKSLKEIVKQQAAVIAELRGGRSKDWITTKLDSVKDFTKGDPVKTEALREKFDVLKAGYRAAKKDVGDDAVFAEAARLVLGGDMDAARKNEQGEAARRRSGQRIQRPSGRRVEAKPDVESEVAELVNRKFFS